MPYSLVTQINQD